MLLFGIPFVYCELCPIAVKGFFLCFTFSGMHFLLFLRSLLAFFCFYGPNIPISHCFLSLLPILRRFPPISLYSSRTLCLF